jgi:RNA polymerase-binding transcription factor DksA
VVSDRPVSSEDLDGAEADVEAVERALGRLDEGTYGTCEVCGAPIGADRLAAEPATRTCAEHAART